MAIDRNQDLGDFYASLLHTANLVTIDIYKKILAATQFHFFSPSPPQIIPLLVSSQIFDLKEGGRKEGSQHWICC